MKRMCSYLYDLFQECMNICGWFQIFFPQINNSVNVLICMCLKKGGGRNVEFHYYDWQFFSEHRKWLLSWSQLGHHNVENGFWVDHYIKKNEKNIEKISFVWILHFDYLWGKYLWHFGVNKNFLTWLNLT